MTRGVLALLILGLAGCVNLNRDLAPVAYDGVVGRTSERSGSLHLTPGKAESDYAPGQIAQFPVNPKVLFNLDDQRVFAESLKGELNRLKLLRVANVSWQQVEPAEVTVEIVFQRTIVFPVAVRYILDVGMRLKSGERSFSRRYFISSSEGESTWTNLNTDAASGKALAAKKLMARLIPDIEAFAAQLP